VGQQSVTALIRRPSSRLDDGIVSHIERRPVDVDRAIEQWEAYGQTLRSAGWRTVEVPAADDCPDSVFVEDTMVVYDGTAVIARPAAPARRSEPPAAEETVCRFGYDIHRIAAPGTLDGGDVLKVGDTIYVGQSGRTNGEGIRQLRAVFSRLGARVIAVPLSKVLHLKTAVTALPDGTIIGWPPALDDPGFFPHFVAMPEESGAHVVVLDDQSVLIAADAPRSADLISRLGYTPVPVDISEYEKLEGCVTCLSVRLRAIPSNSS
jgi:dimethylargininase